MDTIDKYDSSKWTKVNLKRPYDANADWNHNIEVYGKKDAVIHITCDSDDRSSGRGVNYALISDPEMVNALVGEKIFSMEKEKFFQKFGGKLSYDVIKAANFSFSMPETDNVIALDFFFENGKLSALCGKGDDIYKGLPHFEDFKQFVSPSIPEGLFTKGACLEDNVNVLDKPVNGTAKTNYLRTKLFI